MKAKHILLLLGIIFLPCCTSTNEPQEYSTDPVANVESLWTILDQRYCFFEERNIDWDSVYIAYITRARSVKNVYQLYNLMTSMLDLLDDGHVNLYTPFAISSATGWYDSYPRDFSSDILFSSKYLDKYYRINYLYYGRVDSVGYIYLSSFSSSIASSTMHYIDYYFRDCKGVIIDVRNNGGGDLTVAESLAACFFSERTHVGYMRHKIGTGHTDFSEPEELYVDPSDSLIDWSDRAVVVLTNRRSYSATNDFVLRMGKAPNATIVGGTTGGGGGMPLSQELPIGWMVRFSAVPMYDCEMKTTEFGIAPDIELHITEENYDCGEDPIIDRALQILTSKQ